MTHCPRCRQPLKANQSLIREMPEGTVVLVCLPCRKATIEGSGQWVGQGALGSTETIDALRLLAKAAKQERDTVKAIMESPIIDPRWEDMSSWM